jgi:hypothetical protein
MKVKYLVLIYDIHGTLRYLKSNSKELEIAGNYLILNRAGINVITLAMIPQALVSKKKCVPCISYN